MKFLAPKTLYKSFLPLIVANFIFGIGIIHYPPGKPRPIISAIWSIINISIYLCLVNMAHLSRLSHLTGSTVVASNYRNYAYFIASFIIISMCLSQIKEKLIRKGLLKLNSINDRLKRLGIPNDYDLNFKAQVIHFTVALAYIICIMVLDFLYIWESTDDRFSRICFFLVAHHWIMFTFVTDSACVVSMRYYANRFERLNWLLVEPNLHKIYERKSFDRNSDDEDIRSDTLALSEIRGNMALNKFADKQGMLYIIRELRKIHRDLCNTAEEFTAAFDMQLLFSLGLSIGLMTALVYNFYFVVITDSWLWRFDDVMHRIIPVFWISFYFIKVFVILHTGSHATNEAKRTGQLIHTLLNSTIIYNEDVRNEMKIFSLQLLQNPFQLTVCGLFNVDKKLACAMLGSVSTFAIIMIQMRSMYET